MSTQTTPSLQPSRVRLRYERGHTQWDWLDSYHTFSFGEYYAPKHRGFSALRVINEDRVTPNGGFATHSHQDMEIITYVLSGTLAHKDSLGNGSLIHPGDVQRMSAGTGIQHSEFNPSDSEPVHFLQIWIHPSQTGLTPSYEQKTIVLQEQSGQWQLIAASQGGPQTLTIHQDAQIWATQLELDQIATLPLAPNRTAWLQVTKGTIEVGGHLLEAGDAASFDAQQDDLAGTIRVTGQSSLAEVLLFDLPTHF